MLNLIANSALVGAGYAQIFAVLGHRAAGDVNALSLQHTGNQIIGEGLARIFFINQFLDLAFKQHQRSAASLRPMNAFGEKETQLKNALRSVHILARNRAADSRRMDADFFRHFLDHHRFQGVHAALQELALAAHDGFAGSQDSVLALLDVAHQLQGRAVTLFDVFLYVPLCPFLREQLAIAMIEAQGGQVFFIHDHDELATALDKGHVRLDQPRIGAVKTLPGTGIETANKVDGMLDQFRRRAQYLGHLAQVAFLQQRQMLIDNTRRKREHRQFVFVHGARGGRFGFSRAIDCFRRGGLRRGAAVTRQRELKFTALRLYLHQQALAQAARGYAHGIEVLYQLHGLGQQITVLVQVANHIFGCGTQVAAEVQRTQLPEKVIGEGAGLGKKIFKRWFVGLFKTVGRAEARIQIILEVGSKIDLIKRITLVALGLSCNLFDTAVPFGFPEGDVIDEGNALFQLFQHRVLNDLGVDQLLQLQLVERQHTDHLHQARRQYLTLRNLQA